VLRSFRLENHKSIRNEQELVLLPVYGKDRPVVPVAGIFGANASGKSNLLHGLAWMREAVVHSFAAWLPGTGIPRLPFRLDDESPVRPSGYAVDLLLDGVRYSYGFEVDDAEVLREWLHAFPRNRRRVIFDREGREIQFGSTVPELRSRGDVLRELTRGNVLFLSVAALNGIAEVGPVFQWFLARLVFGLLDERTAEEALLSYLNGDRHDAVVELIRAADLGITNVSVQRGGVVLTASLINRLIDARLVVVDDPDRQRLSGERVSGLNIPDRRALDDFLRSEPGLGATSRLRFHHGTSNAAFTMEDQSQGTRSWIGLVCRTLDALNNGGVLVIDEIDASMHPHLTTRLVGLFQDEDTNPHLAQLVFTSHDATLLSPMMGGETLERDQVWFIEKQADGGSRLYPLTDFRPRQGENTARRYITGSYGAVPTTSQYEFSQAVEDLAAADAR